MKRVKAWGSTVAVTAVLGSVALLYFNYFANGTSDPASTTPAQPAALGHPQSDG